MSFVCRNQWTGKEGYFVLDQRKEALDYILKQEKIKTVFQPIISLRDGHVLGHEALSRITCETAIKDIDMLFNIAEECKRLWDLELLCRTRALEAAYKFMVPPYSKKLFLNVNPNIMRDQAFKEGFTKSFLEQYEITPSNVIFEITERNVISDMAGFRATIDHYKNQDYEIAIDDAGAGYSGLNLISDISPNFIKLDMKLIRNVDTDNLKYALVKGMVEFSKVSKVSLIAEGIESYEELNTLVNLGVQYGQGYFIQKPEELVKEISQELLMELKKINIKKNYTTQNILPNIYISNICTTMETVSPTELVQNIYDKFKQNPDCYGLCVIENHMPVGIVTKEKLTLKLSGQYGFALYQSKAISQLMDREFLTVDARTHINKVSTLSMSRPNDKLYDFIVVTENQKYMGVITIKNLLQKTTQIEITAAKHQNPLSGLPGNLVIEQRLMQCLTNHKKYSVAYFDIDNFKAYNDVYGFENGDLVIKLLADTLKDSISDEEFVGHIGGDDFVIILNHHIKEDYFKNLKNQFEKDVLAFYHQKDIQTGYITTANRRGKMEQFPLITLTYVMINNETQTFQNVMELTELLAKLKKDAKQKINSMDRAVKAV